MEKSSKSASSLGWWFPSETSPSRVRGRSHTRTVGFLGSLMRHRGSRELSQASERVPGAVGLGWALLTRPPGCLGQPSAHTEGHLLLILPNSTLLLGPCPGGVPGRKDGGIPLVSVSSSSMLGPQTGLSNQPPGPAVAVTGRAPFLTHSERVHFRTSAPPSACPCGPRLPPLLCQGWRE